MQRSGGCVLEDCLLAAGLQLQVLSWLNRQVSGNGDGIFERLVTVIIIILFFCLFICLA